MNNVVLGPEPQYHLAKSYFSIYMDRDEEQRHRRDYPNVTEKLCEIISIININEISFNDIKFNFKIKLLDAFVLPYFR